jgi:hypothetical protein
MPEQSTPSILERVIRALYLVMVGSSLLGGGLVSAAFVSIPVLGFAAGLLAAVGVWSCLLGAFSACLLLVPVLMHRWRTGRWYFGVRQQKPK